VHRRVLEEGGNQHDVDQNRECDPGIPGARVARRAKRRARRNGALDDEPIREPADAGRDGRQPWTKCELRALAGERRGERPNEAASWLALDWKLPKGEANDNDSHLRCQARQTPIRTFGNYVQEAGFS
jgi:hypothetical protein